MGFEKFQEFVKSFSIEFNVLKIKSLLYLFRNPTFIPMPILRYFVIEFYPSHALSSFFIIYFNGFTSNFNSCTASDRNRRIQEGINWK